MSKTSDNTRRNRFLGIRYQLLIALVLAVIIPVIMTTITSTQRATSSNKEQKALQLETIVSLRTVQIDLWLDNILFELGQQITPSLVGEAEDVFSGNDNDALSASLNQINQRLGQVNNVFLVDMDAVVIESTDQELIGTQFTSWVISGRLRQPYVTSPVTGTSDSTTVLVLQPVLDDSPQQIAVLVAEYNTSRLIEIMDEPVGLGETGENIILDRRGTLITNSRFQGYPIGDTTINTRAQVVSTQNQDSGYITYDDYRGVDVIGAYAWYPRLELVLIAKQDVYEVLAPVRETLRTNGLITIFVAGLTIIVGAFLVNRRISNPLQSLSNTAKNIAGGNLALRSDITVQNEIGDLSNSFNQMTNQLSNLINTLESRVAERTRDLQIVSDVSQQAAQILDLNKLLFDVVNLTCDSFGLYHVGIFVHYPEENELKLDAASGSNGKIMVEEGKQFFVDAEKGLVPLTARSLKPTVVNDVRTADGYFQNPLLPESKSELAIPMVVVTEEGNHLVGVLDIQSQNLNHFTDNEVAIFTTLTSQIAVAVRNVQLFEDARIARHQAEQADHIKAQFLASMSHELRTPLNSILTFSELMEMGTFGDVNEEQEDYLGKILFSGRHLLALINDVLDISKMESGMMKLFIEGDFDVIQETKQVSASVEKLIGDKDVELILDVDSTLPMLAIDKRRIRQVLFNILSNAVKFTEEGTITLSAKHKGDSVLFAVIDTGPGIPANQQDLIFEPFQQTETGIKHAGGTGLGLPISKRLVEAHGGRLWLESTVGDGSIFYFTLPIKPAVKLGEVSIANMN